MNNNKKTIIAIVVAAIIVGLFTFVAGFAAGSAAITHNGVFITMIKDVFPPTTPIVIIGYMLAALLDILTGIIKAFIKENFCSSEMRKGLWKKAVTVGMIAITAILDAILYVLGLKISQYLTIGVAAWFIAMEVGSLIENAGECGVPIPGILRKAIKVLQEKGEAEESASDENTTEENEVKENENSSS